MKKREYQDFAPNVQISSETMLTNSKENKFKDVLWTSDIKKELPIFLGRTGPSSTTPRTIIELFEAAVEEMKEEPAMYIERGTQWVNFNWVQYHYQVTDFARAAISIGVEPFQTVNILGANSPEWLFSFLGGIYSCVVPVGIYTTNNSEACMYIAEHSDCGIIACDSIDQYKKYEKRLGELHRLKAVVIWGQVEQEEIRNLVNPYVAIYSWREFMKMGKRSSVDLDFKHRKEMQNPGNCCNVVYTSGTTGNPKAVLLSHDNMLYSLVGGKDIFPSIERMRIVSYLPLSHIAGQQIDIIGKDSLSYRVDIL